MSLIVATIDIGTTYSCWAFSSKSEFESNPTRCSVKSYASDNTVSSKEPTCILIRPDGKTIHSYGYDAENKYASLVENDEHGHWYYFRLFKMKLFSSQGMQKDIVLKDRSGNKLAAKTVLSLSIKYMKDDLVAAMTYKKQSSVYLRDIFDIIWVLTVPAIWNDAGKQFMREAAIDAGIACDKLKITLESEAAIMLCRHLPVEPYSKGEFLLASFGPGTRYLVLDAGGGTVDITVHEVLPSGQMKKLHKRSEGAWGAANVDNAFLTFLKEIVGSDVMTTFKDKHQDEYSDMLRDFENKKKTMEPSNRRTVTLGITPGLVFLVEEMNGITFDDSVKQTQYADKVKMVGNKMRVDHCIMESFFRTSINSLLIHMKTLFSTCVGIDAIIMVGGFSESPLLQDAIRQSFGNIRLIIPNESGFAVLKGALIYGHTSA